MKRSAIKSVPNNKLNRPIDWELRPGGLLVQKRDINVGDADSGPLIKLIISHDSYHHHISAPSQSTFGYLKRILAHETGLEPKEQRLLFRGKEKDDEEFLHIAGVKDMSKIILLEDPACKERKLEEMKRNQEILKACEEISKVKKEVDKLYEKVVFLERTVRSGVKAADKEFLVLTELLMLQLLKLDTIEADGEAKVQRRIEVRRIQNFVDMLDNLKARNSSPFSNNGSTVAVTAKWETFETGVGSLNAPRPLQTKITEDWEQFD